jgi:hypothetical protein
MGHKPETAHTRRSQWEFNNGTFDQVFRRYHRKEDHKYFSDLGQGIPSLLFQPMGE